MIIAITIVSGVIMFAMAIALAPRRRSAQAQAQTARKLVSGLRGFNLMLALMMAGLGLVWLFVPATALAAGLPQQAAQDPYATLAAAIAVSLGSIGAAYAVSSTGSAAIGAIAEKPEVFGRALIFVGMAEGVAIYGLIIAFLILFR
jgi:V/A-type H+-transporting ATPase subunit K